MIVLVCVDNYILISKSSSAIDEFTKSIKDGTENFDFTDEISMNTYLGVDVSCLHVRKGFKLSQKILIQRIIQAVNVDPALEREYLCGNTPVVYPLLSKDENSPAGKATWKYQGVVGMLP